MPKVKGHVCSRYLKLGLQICFPSCFSNWPVDRSRRGYKEAKMVSSLVSCAWLKQQLDEKRQDIRVLDGTARETRTEIL